MLETPVAFLIFNRPDVTEKVFEQIALARPRKLLVVADGPRTQQEAEICEKTRAIIDRVDWDCEVLTNYSEANMGCRLRISSGIDWVFSLVPEAIILEDDCLPHPSFFPFCEQLLERYRDDTRVMMISGTNFLIDQLDILESYTFTQYPSIWGWATWRRAWQLYDVDVKLWPQMKAQGQLKHLIKDDHVSKFYERMWDSLVRIDTWDYQWSFARRFNNGLGVAPRKNLVSNIGNFGTHHSNDDPNLHLPTFVTDNDNLIHPATVFPDQRYDAPLCASERLFGSRVQQPFIYRALRKIWRITGGRLKATRK